jgi:16S rRNA (guanine966-N2)-methyltransferase
VKAGQVRIIGGQWRRSLLAVPDLPGLRPTGDRVRETLFNWLGQELGGWRVLDAFAGSGALGLEAASRGAQVLLVDQHPKAQEALRAAVARLQGAAERVRVQGGDGFAALAAGGYDLAFIDPPFGSEAFERALAAVHADARWLYLEAPRAIAPPAGWQLHRHLKAGAVHAHLFGRENPGP